MLKKDPERLFFNDFMQLCLFLSLFFLLGSLTTITANNNSTTNNNNGNNNSNSSAVININGPTSTITSSNSLSSSLTNGLQEHSCQNGGHNGGCDWICFNFGKELYTYAYRGVKKVRYECVMGSLFSARV